jgi:glycine dehydrogenase subunit 2
MKYIISEMSKPGKIGCMLPALDLVPTALPDDSLLRRDFSFPELSEVDVARYFTALSKLNYGIDTGFYPLGSCTMKYNPKWHEDVSGFAGFSSIHPYQHSAHVQGALRLIYELQLYLTEITGMSATSLTPMGGAQGEFANVLMIKAYHESRGDGRRTKLLIPDSAHGTNPATASMCGYSVQAVPSDSAGNVDISRLKASMDGEVAALTLTMPNTLGLFDPQIEEIGRIVHQNGSLLCGDGANLNSLIGKVKFGDLGFDCVQLNLHKTFSTPHGGGGPGSGPVCVNSLLADFLPAPTATSSGGKYLFETPVHSVGSLGAAYGNFGAMIKAYCYIRSLGAHGLLEVCENAVINANYIRKKLSSSYCEPYDRTCMHEVVLSARWQKAGGISALDIAKRLLDLGFHSPTIYFPLIVDEALMIEPTESESKETMDAFISAMLQIAREAKENPDLLHSAPHATPVRRLDEVTAARKPDLRWDSPDK